MARSWTRLVAEGRRLVRQEGDAKWSLGDLALEIAPTGEYGVTNASGETLAEFAEAIGIETNTLQQYRRIAAAWPRARARARAAWSVYAALAPYADAEKILDRLVARGKATVDEARKAVGSKPTGLTHTTSRDRLTSAKQLLDDPEVRRQLVADNRVRRDLNVAERELDARRAATVARQQREDAPRLVEAKEFYEAQAQVLRMRADGLRALELLRGLPSLSEAEREELRYALELVESVTGFLNEFTKARRAGTLADEVEDFLAEQT